MPLKDHQTSMRGLLALVAVIVMGSSLAASPLDATAAHSPSQKHEKAQVRKHKKAKVRKKKAQHRKHKQAQARGHHRGQGNGPKAHGPVVPTPGITEYPNGWIHYEPTAPELQGHSGETTRVEGTLDLGGVCNLETSSTMPPRGQELIREQIAYNPDTCEAVYLERLIGRPDPVQPRIVPGDPGTVKYATGHNMQLWVDPVGITITGLNIDLSWPLYGAKGRWGAVPYSYKWPLDGWQVGKVQRDILPVTKENEYGTKQGVKERMWGTAQEGAPSGGKRAVAYRRFENIDFYKAVKSAKGGAACNNVPTTWTVFEHEVQVIGYKNGRMGTWQHNSKSGPCENLVHPREKVAWGLKRDNFPIEFDDEPLHTLLPRHAFTASPDEMVIDESTDPVPYDLLPTEINLTSVKLSGGVNPRGVSTNWWAQCGTTTAYGMWASGQVNIGSGTSSVPVSVTVPNLQPNTTYHCRMVTLNTQGQAAFSADEEFTTRSDPPAVASAYTTDITENSAKILGWLNPNGGATNFYFQWGYTVNYGNTAPAPPGWSAGSGNEPFLAGYDLSGLEPNTTYHYRLVASSAAGTVYGPDQTFNTLNAVPIVTTSPATEVGLTSARLNGWVNPHGYPTDYYFEYGKTKELENRFPAAPGAPVGSGNGAVFVSNVVTGLEPGTTYYYRLGAPSNQGIGYGEIGTFTTTGPAIEDELPGEVTQSKVTLASKIDPRGYATSYYFEYGMNDAYGSKTEEKSLPAGNGFQSVSAAVEGLPVGWTIHYRLVAKSAQGTHTGPDRVVTSAWRNEPGTGPAAAISEGLEDVSCPAAGSCIAVGSYLNGDTGRTQTAAMRLSGGSWSALAVPAPAWTNSTLTALSCASATSCLAVGSADKGFLAPDLLIMKWDGSAWSDVSAGLQEPAEFDYRLNDVDCPAANSCEVVGYTSPANGVGVERTLALHWDGSTWTVRQSANPLTPGGAPSLEDNALKAVSCASVTVCKAVGSHVASPGGTMLLQKPLILSLSGSEWISEDADLSAFTSPETQFWLEGVSCPTTTVCLAVGYFGGNNFAGTRWAFTQRWNGTQWLNQSVYDETNQATKLYDVSCSSATSCRAVGKDGRGLHWSGTQWKLQAPKAPAELEADRGTQLAGVSCPTSTECHAVGAYADKATHRLQRLTQAWSGTGAVPGASWTTPSPITETGATLRGKANPAGVDASYYFEYGPTTSYGMKTPGASAGSHNLGSNVNAWVTVETPITGLQAGREYHYRVVVTNGASTVYGADTTFKTKCNLCESPVTEAFNGSSTEISDFATKWAPLQWAGSTRKGKNNANGYGPVDTALNGAYFIPTVTDSGAGIAAQATLAAAPGVGGHVSLWLDMEKPAVEKRGYELNFTETAANTYTVALKRYFGANITVLGSQTGFSFPPGSQMALVDKGGEVAAWANTGSGYTKVLGATDTFYNTGAAGVEIQGATTTRLTNFKLGTLAEQVTYFEQAVKSIPLIDAFARTESPLSLTNSWLALNWATATVKTGKVDPTAGWTPTEWSTSPAGAYWQKAMASDTGTGDAVMATYTNSFPPGSPYYASLWLNAPSPGTVKSGYQLRIVGTGYWPQELKLYKWVNGTQTLLGTKTVDFPVGGPGGAKFALVDKGNTLSVWSSPAGGNLTQAYTATDTTYSYGYAGVEGAGPTGLKDFKLGQLPRSQF
jgi:hypothetical protein